MKLPTTLEELYLGAVKKLIYNKQIINTDGRTTSFADETIEVEIHRGYNQEKTLTFKGLGNEFPGLKNSIT